MRKNILIIHGPNLNLLGNREPEIYGQKTLKAINQMIENYGEKIGFHIQIFFSNFEGAIIEFIQREAPKSKGIIFNLAGYTHSSIAILDSLIAFPIKKIEVHLSNIYKRESFRQVSLYHSIADGIIIGLGSQSYLLALDALKELLK